MTLIRLVILKTIIYSNLIMYHARYRNRTHLPVRHQGRAGLSLFSPLPVRLHQGLRLPMHPASRRRARRRVVLVSAWACEEWGEFCASADSGELDAQD